MWSIIQASNAYDPFPEFLYLGEDIKDGIFAWMQIGINTTADYINDEYYNYAATIQEDGVHVNTNCTLCQGGPPPGGSGGPPPGWTGTISATPAPTVV